MKKSLAELQYERTRLVARIAAQRVTLGHQAAPLARASDLYERVVDLAHRAVAYARQHPLAMAGLLGTLLVLKPRSGWRWLQRGLLLWRGWRAVRQWQPARVLNHPLLRRFF